jgi:catechol 2,3-dioxygenase-like lactoylglutathione lyase family enzyme
MDVGSDRNAMKSPLVQGVRSVALTVPDLARAEQFYTEVWKLDVAARTDETLYLSGSGVDHHLLTLRQAPGAPRILKITLRARSSAALAAIVAATRAADGSVEESLAATHDAAGGERIVIRDPDGRRYEIVHGDVRRVPKDPVPADQPQRLAHVVVNSRDVTKTQTFLERALGFVLADRTRIMAFMNCDSDHHSLAIGDTDNDALNHIAFVMPSIDAVMRGGGRLRDAGHAIEWGPGRHGPGNNVFNYFIDPFGIVIEYTADVGQIDESYRPGTPSDWSWPVGRTDQWGIATPATARLKDAQRSVRFAPKL